MWHFQVCHFRVGLFFFATNSLHHIARMCLLTLFSAERTSSRFLLPVTCLSHFLTTIVFCPRTSSIHVSDYSPLLYLKHAFSYRLVLSSFHLTLLSSVYLQAAFDPFPLLHTPFLPSFRPTYLQPALKSLSNDFRKNLPSLQPRFPPSTFEALLSTLYPRIPIPSYLYILILPALSMSAFDLTSSSCLRFLSSHSAYLLVSTLPDPE